MVISRFAPAGAASAYGSRSFVEAVEHGRFTFRVRPQSQTAVMYVEDSLAGIVQLIDAPAERLSRRVYNIQSFSATAYQIAEAIRRQLPGVEFEFAPEADVVKLVESWPKKLDDSAARRDWGWQPQYDLDQMAAHFIRELSS